MTEDPFVAHLSLPFTVAYELLVRAADAKTCRRRVVVGWMQHDTNRSVIATGPVVDLRPLRSRQRGNG